MSTGTSEHAPQPQPQPQSQSRTQSPRISRGRRSLIGSLVSGLLVLAGVCVLLVAAARAIPPSAFASTGGSGYHTARASATVLDVDDDQSGRGIDVSYTADGAVQVTWIDLADVAALPRRGDTVEIAYDPSQVEDAVLASSLDTAGAATVAFSTPAAASSAAPAHQTTLVAVGLGLLGSGALGVVLTVLWVRRAPQPVRTWQAGPYGASPPGWAPGSPQGGYPQAGYGYPASAAAPYPQQPYPQQPYQQAYQQPYPQPYPQQPYPQPYQQQPYAASPYPEPRPPQQAFPQEQQPPSPRGWSAP